MISPDRRITQKQIYDFLRTVTIKYEPIAHYTNNTVAAAGYSVNDNDPTTWKYYLNMQGKYHESDTKMYVTSLDNREVILFSPETLAQNLRTRAVYVPGGKYYQRLCDLYPSQVDLIKSILFPVTDVTKAIMAPNLTLLGYGDGYLEPQEQSVFIMEIEKFLVILKERWYFDFLDDEPYFYLTFWSSVPIYLAMLLISGRMSHIRTPYVHSSDIWDELASNGVSNYSDILNRDKAMFLYQNIDYLRANAGKQSNLVILADALLSSLGIGLYGRMVVQETETGAADYQLTPQLVPIRIPNVSELVPASIEVKNVAEVQAELYDKGLTPSEAAETTASIERELGDTTRNEFVTKFVELRPVAQNKPYADLLNTFLMETLVTSIISGYYTTPVEVFDPLTQEPIYLPPAELLALYTYAINQSMGITLTQFPTSVRLYHSFDTNIRTPTKTILYNDKVFYLSEQVDANAFLSGLNYDTQISSPADFTTNVTNLWLRYLSHVMADQNTLIDKRHAAYAYLSSLCHTRRDAPINLVSGYDNYADWLGTGGIDITSTILVQYALQSEPLAQWANLADAIITALIPTNDTLILFGNFTLSDSGYERLRELFVQLLSYRIVILESDRATADYSIGAKWSTDYGPDVNTDFVEYLIASQESITSTTYLRQGVSFVPGYQEKITTDTNTFVGYTVTTQTDLQKTVTTHEQDSPPITVATSSTDMTSGMIMRHYGAALPQLSLP